MIPEPKPPAVRRADDIVDAYLAQHFNIGLEDVLLGGINGELPAAVAGAVTIEAKLASRWPYGDGGVAEHFSGTFTLQGVAYAFRCCAYSVPASYVGRFLTEVSAFEPVEWSTAMRIDDGTQA